MASRKPNLTKQNLESDLQNDKVIPFLKKHGCFVMKLSPMMGIPRGTADIFFCKELLYGFLECKKSKDAKRQPGQAQFIKKMDDWAFARVVYPENWEEIKAELKDILCIE